MKKKADIKKSTSFNQLLDSKYGKIGTAKRELFEEGSQLFIISEMLKEARRQAHLTQEQLAEKIGTKKSYISRIENGKADIQLSSFFKIIEQGLGRRIHIEFR